MKKLLALLLVLCLGCSFALAEHVPMMTYTDIEGVQVADLEEAAAFACPTGLEGMYTFMCGLPEVFGSLFIARMPGGYALASVYCESVREHLSAEALMSLWPDVLASFRVQDNAEPDEALCGAEIVPLYDEEAVHMTAVLTLEDGLRVQAEGVAFCTGYTLYEVWGISPIDADVFSEAEQETLGRDQQILQAFLAGLEFPAGEESGEAGSIIDGTMQHIEPDRPPETLTISLPEEAIVLTPGTPEADVNALHDRFVSVHPDGGERLFDAIRNDLAMDCRYVFTPDLGSWAGICSTYLDASIPQRKLFELLRSETENVRDAMAELYGTVVSMAVEEDVRSMGGVDNLCMTFDVQCDGLSMLIEAMFGIKAGRLYELDVFTAEGCEAEHETLMGWLSTLTYTPPEAK